MKEKSYGLPMDEARRLLSSLAGGKGQPSLSSLSAKAGKNVTYLQQFITKGSPRELPEEVRIFVAAELGIDDALLRSSKSSGHPIGAHNMRLAGYAAPTWTVPAYGHANGGSDGEFPFNGAKIADLPAPASLRGIENAYAVYVVGESMVPRYYPGEVVFVNPNIPLRRGVFVIAQIRKPGSVEGDAPLAYVKRFEMWTESQLRLEQFNPHKILRFAKDSVVSVHRIIMGGDA